MLRGRCPNRWSVMFEEVESWVEGHERPPNKASTDEQEKRLARWWAKQHERKRKGTLEEVREELLEGVEDFWRQGRWERSFARADKWHGSHKDCEPKRVSQDPEEKAAARFVNNQRLRQKQLSQQQIETLEATQWWKPRVYKRPAVAADGQQKRKKTARL